MSVKDLRDLEFYFVESSNLFAFSYHPYYLKLYVVFNNFSTYSYSLVPAPTILRFIEAESKGSYFHKHIKNSFPMKKITDGEGDRNFVRIKLRKILLDFVEKTSQK